MEIQKTCMAQPRQGPDTPTGQIQKLYDDKLMKTTGARCNHNLEFQGGFNKVSKTAETCLSLRARVT